jgi:hypothetical protein
LVYVGDKRVLDMGMKQAKVDVACRWIKTPGKADWSDEASVPAIDLGNIDPALFPPGVSSADSPVPIPAA